MELCILSGKYSVIDERKWCNKNLQMPLKAIDMKLLSNYPLRRWFLNIKIWEALYMTDGEQCYKILDGDTDGIDDIVIALQTYVRNFFSKV